MRKEETEPMDNPHRIPVRLRFTQEQFEKLTSGHNPEAMEDKWFIYVENNVIHCHRSWTGYETYRAELQFSNGNYVITEILAERNAKKYTNTDDERDAELFAKVLAYLVLETSLNDIQEK
jgi:hypothetical protein